MSAIFDEDFICRRNSLLVLFVIDLC